MAIQISIKPYPLNFIIYDLEATCWMGRPRKETQEIIEIGAVKINGYGELTGVFNKFIRPKVNPKLSSFCKELTSIKQEEVDRADYFQTVVEHFQDWINIFEEDYLLCSWGGFDKRIFINNCELHDMDSDWALKHINLKNQYQSIKSLQRPYGLKKAVATEGFEFTGIHHRAIADAENLAKVFTKYLDEWQY